MSSFNRFPMAQNLENKKKFAQIGQQISEICENKVSGPSGEPGDPKKGVQWVQKIRKFIFRVFGSLELPKPLCTQF